MHSDIKVLTKSQHGLISGTLRGLADYYGLKLNRLQLVFIISAFFGVGFVFYFILWVSLPSYTQRETLIKAKQAKLN